MVVLYLTGYMSIQTRSDPTQVEWQTKVFHYAFGLISPVSQLLRAAIVGLNLFGLLCSGSPPEKASYAGDINLYGGPILYLIIQSLLMFAFLIWNDHNFTLGKAGRKKRQSGSPNLDQENTHSKEPEVIEEEDRAIESDNGLRALHVNKVYNSSKAGKVHAVVDVTFGIKRGEVFGLVGPNGGEYVYSVWGFSSNEGQLANQQRFQCSGATSNPLAIKPSCMSDSSRC
jgi:ATP-binding cassette subfamily A (ABC1) protein 3